MTSLVCFSVEYMHAVIQLCMYKESEFSHHYACMCSQAASCSMHATIHVIVFIGVGKGYIFVTRVGPRLTI